jgi:ATP synthase subunit 6
MTIVSLFNISMSNFSPLDQFDDMSWTLYNSLFENATVYSFYTFELEYSLFETWARNGIFPSYFANGSFILFSLLVAGLVYVKKYPYVQDFSILFFLGFLHLFTISVLFFWFDDFVFGTFTGGADYFDIVSMVDFTNRVFLGETAVNFLPQVNFAFALDENFMTFLAGFFLLGGAEEEEEENFLLEEEESDFVEDIVAPIFVANLGKDVEDNGALFLKLNTVFAFVLFNNLIGMIPYSDTATSSLILTFWTSLSVFGSLMYLLLKKQGVAYFFSLFMPSGSPLPLMFLLVPIEFISYSFRLVSLSVRLFANMFAGHTLLKVIVGFSWSMILVGDIFLVVNLIPVAILVVLTFLELAVAIVQAYIFTTLTAIYLKDIFVAH